MLIFGSYSAILTNFRDLGPSSGRFGPSWAALGPILGPSWAVLGPFWARLGASLGPQRVRLDIAGLGRNALFAVYILLDFILRPSSANFANLRRFGAILGPSWAILGRLGAVLGPLGAVLGRLGAVLAGLGAVLGVLRRRAMK